MFWLASLGSPKTQRIIKLINQTVSEWTPHCTIPPSQNNDLGLIGRFNDHSIIFCR
jgi:hypothetical protein